MKKTSRAAKLTPANIRGAPGWFGGCECLKFPSIQINRRGGLGWILTLVSHALWGELELTAALPGLDSTLSLLWSKYMGALLPLLPIDSGPNPGHRLWVLRMVHGCANISKDPSPGPPLQSPDRENHPHLCCLITFTPWGFGWGTAIQAFISAPIWPPPASSLCPGWDKLAIAFKITGLHSQFSFFACVEKSVGNFILILKQSLLLEDTIQCLCPVNYCSLTHSEKYFCHNPPLLHCRSNYLEQAICHSIAPFQ